MVGGIGLPYNGALASDIAVSRDLPDPSTVKPGITFEVTITFTAPQDNFNAIVLHDEAPEGWQVAVDKAACLPPPLTAKTEGTSGIEYSWLGPFDAGQTFRAVYEVMVPSEATGGSHALRDGWLVYFIVSDEHQSGITGDSQVGVITAPEESADDIIVTDLDVSPPEADIGEPVTISAVVSNTGDSDSSYIATLKVDGVEEKTLEVTLAAGDSEKVTFTTSEDSAGSHTVSVDGLDTTLKVKEITDAAPVLPPAPRSASFNWPVLWGIAGGVVLIIGLALLIRHGRRQH